MEFRAEIVIDASASAAWAVLGEGFGHIGEWATPIERSLLDGELRVDAVRSCHIARFGPVPAGVIKERLIEFDPGAMSFAYEAVEGMPGFIGRAVNRWSVKALGEGRCVIHTRATLSLRGIAVLFTLPLRYKIQRDGARVLDELRYRVEHGEAHPRKVAAMKSFGRVRGT